MSMTAARIVRDPNTGRKALGFSGDGLRTEDYLPAAQLARYDTATGLGTPRWGSPTGRPINDEQVQARFRRGTERAQLRADRRMRGLNGTGAPAFRFQDPGASGACPPRGAGLGWFGFFYWENTGTTAAGDITNQPELDVRVTHVVAGGTNLNNWSISQFDVNRMVVKQGGLAPATIFHPFAQRPIPFDLTLAPQDRMHVNAAQVVASGEPATGILQIGGSYCFKSTCETSAYPCDEPIVKLDTKQIILGIGTAAASLADGYTVPALGSPSLSDTPDQDTLLGGLVMSSSMNATSPDEAPVAGYSSANGSDTLPFVSIRQIDVQNVLRFTSSPTIGTTGGGTGVTSAIPGLAFDAQSPGLFFPDLIVGSAQTINIYAINTCVVASSTAANNNISLLAAFVGCMLTCD